MSGYIGINLRDILKDDSLGESVAKDVLSSFSCPLNPDVEHFLRHTAIEFTKQSIASTYLIMASYKQEYVLCGYFTLSNKVFCIERESLPNQRWKHRMSKFGQFDKTIQRYTISAPLINFYESNGFVNFGLRSLDRDETDKLSGDSLVQMLRYME